MSEVSKTLPTCLLYLLENGEEKWYSKQATAQGGFWPYLRAGGVVDLFAPVGALNTGRFVAFSVVLVPSMQ